MVFHCWNHSFPEPCSMGVSGIKGTCTAGLHHLGSWNISAMPTAPPSLCFHFKDGGMLTKCPLTFYLCSVMSDAAKKALWCPLSSQLICEPPATGLSSMSGLLDTPPVKLNAVPASNLREASLQEGHSTAFTFPRCCVHAPGLSRCKLQHCCACCHF